MRLDEMISDRNDDRPMTDEEYQRAKKNVSLFDVLDDGTGDHEPPDRSTQRFLKEAARRKDLLFGDCRAIQNPWEDEGEYKQRGGF